MRTLAERDIRARYKQTVLGFAWAVVIPVMYMIVFTLFFRRVADVRTGDVPYALFTYVALLPWTFFSNSVSLGGPCLLMNMPLLNKVYCPREVFPLASVLVAGVDMAVATLVLGVLFGATTFAPKATTLWVPLLLAVQVAFTLGLLFLLSSIVVYLRDLRHLIVIVLQLGLFATPVAYSLASIPEGFRRVYCLVNPLVPVIDGYRRTILYGQPPNWDLLGLGALTACIVLVGGYMTFKRLETGIADVA
ncbi:MAG: ABC transporter permease [Actinomycetota bacterium]